MTVGRGFKTYRVRLWGAAPALALGYAAYMGIQSWLYRAALGRALRDLNRGHYAAAAPQLAALARRWPGAAEVEYGLGDCELALGHPDAALAAWARVPPGSPLCSDAALARGRLGLERGRFSEAERALSGALAVDPAGPRAVDIRRHLIHLFVQEGRYDEAQTLLEATVARPGRHQAGRGAGRRPAHIAIDLDTSPLTGLRAVLDRAAALAPGDGRVALARANLATREGRLDDARHSLDDALRAGPADCAVARARIRWALAAGRDAEVEAAAAALGSGGLSADDRLALDAWRAARRGDRRGDRAAWERLAESGPAPRDPRPSGDFGPRRRRRPPGRGAPPPQSGDRPGAEPLPHPDARRRAGRQPPRAGPPRSDTRAPVRGPRVPGDGRPPCALRPRSPPAPWPPPPTTHRPPPPPCRSPSRRSSWTTWQRPAGRRPSPSRLRSRGSPTTPRRRAWRSCSGAARRPSTSSPRSWRGGVGLLDFDGDGFLDVYCRPGRARSPRSAPPRRRRPPLPQSRRRRRSRTPRSGPASAAPRGGYGHGVAVGDVDNDGHPDLFVTRWRSYALLPQPRRRDVRGRHRAGRPRRATATGRPRPPSPTWTATATSTSTSATTSPGTPHTRGSAGARRGQATRHCDPTALEPEPDHVFRNDGGRFVDVTAEAGIADGDGRGLGVVAADLDGDGRIDLFVANDGSANFFFRNLGGFRFEEAGLASGVAANASGGYQAGMGVACGDLDGDGRLDLAVTNFFGESTTFYQEPRPRRLRRADRRRSAWPRRPGRCSGSGSRFSTPTTTAGSTCSRPTATSTTSARPSPTPCRRSSCSAGPGAGSPTSPPAPASRSGPPPRPRARGGRPRQRRPDRRPARRPGRAAGRTSTTGPSGGHCADPSLEGAASNRDAVGARGDDPPAAGAGRWRPGSAGAATCPPATPGSTSAWGPRRRPTPSRFAGPRAGSTRFAGLKADRGYALREGDPAAEAARRVPGAGPPLTPARRPRAALHPHAGRSSPARPRGLRAGVVRLSGVTRLATTCAHAAGLLWFHGQVAGVACRIGARTSPSVDFQVRGGARGRKRHTVSFHISEPGELRVAPTPSDRGSALIQGVPAMCRSRQSKVSAALIGLTLLGAVSFTGCGDQQQSGTTVTDTPEAEAGRKASMDGMKALMEQEGAGPWRTKAQVVCSPPVSTA